MRRYSSEGLKACMKQVALTSVATTPSPTMGFRNSGSLVGMDSGVGTESGAESKELEDSSRVETWMYGEKWDGLGALTMGIRWLASVLRYIFRGGTKCTTEVWTSIPGGTQL